MTEHIDFYDVPKDEFEKYILNVSKKYTQNGYDCYVRSHPHFPGHCGYS